MVAVSAVTANPAPVRSSITGRKNTATPKSGRSSKSPPSDPSAHTGAEKKDEVRRQQQEDLASLSLGVFHDLNNLMGIVMTNLSEAARQGSVRDKMELHVDQALAAAQQARSFITETMRLAHDMPVQKELANLATIIRETARVSQSGSGVNLHLHLPKNLWWAEVNGTQIIQVLQNLILNGIQAMGNQGYMDVFARNVVIPEKHLILLPGPHVEVLVRDRGCGMEPDLLQLVFREPFTTKTNGNGIGLTTCKRIIAQHQGHIAVTSKPDQGTEITFWLPAIAKTASAASSRKHPPLRIGTGTVLVVEDEAHLRKLMLTVLKQCGYDLHEVSSGEEAVNLYGQLLSADKNLVVVMDLSLKGELCGEATLQKIKALHPAAKVIAASGGLVSESRQSYLKKGFVDILPKPFMPADIAEVVHRTLG